ncbi:hypothetical protein [Streptomyces mirabilis]|uniref:hypothetical protein n=1 Tax=Streptomyces mirabilis TaxID=68239 RepID=UPI00365A4D61
MQLVVVLVLPTRDYAALLVSAGWILTRPTGVREQDIQREMELLRPQLPLPVRMTAGDQMVADVLYSIGSGPDGMRIRIGPSQWRADKVDHIELAPGLPPERFGRIRLTPPGSLARAAGHTSSWAAEHCRGTVETAVIGKRSVLSAEMELCVGWPNGEGDLQSLDSILRPDKGKSPSWASVLLPGGTGEMPEVPGEAAMTVLDGASAVRWLPLIEVPIVAVIVDASSAAEAAEDALLSVRATGRHVPLSAIQWTPPAGTQALAFEVPL